MSESLGRPIARALSPFPFSRIVVHFARVDIPRCILHYSTAAAAASNQACDECSKGAGNVAKERGLGLRNQRGPREKAQHSAPQRPRMKGPARASGLFRRAKAKGHYSNWPHEEGLRASKRSRG